MRVSTFLWFCDEAEEAATFYTGLFAGSRITETRRTADGKVTTVAFDLAGQSCIAFNGGTPLPRTAAMSMFAECDTQDDIDEIWSALADGGSEGPGGSLTDRFGITWQVLPAVLNELLDSSAPETAERILAAVHGMQKISIQRLIDAGSH